MGESDAVMLGTRTRRFVDHLDAVILEEVHLLFDVVCLKANVMQTGAVLGEKSSDRGVVIGRTQKLNLSTSAELHKRDFNFLLGHHVTVHDFSAYDIVVECAGTVEVCDGDRDVGNVLQHIVLQLVSG